MNVTRDILKSVEKRKATGELGNIPEEMLLSQDMLERLLDLPQSTELLDNLVERALTNDDSGSVEAAGGDDDDQSVVSKGSGSDSVHSIGTEGGFNIIDWIDRFQDQAHGESPDDDSENLEPISSKHFSQFLLEIGYIDSQQLEVIKLQAEVDRAITTAILQYRDSLGVEMRCVSGAYEEAFYSYNAVQSQLKAALKHTADGGMNGGPLSMLHCIAMAKEPTTPLHESPPLSLYETAGARVR